MQTSVPFVAQQLATRQGGDLERAVETHHTSSVRDLVYDVLGGAAHASVKAIQAEAKRINTPVKDFSTTLLLAAHKKMAAGEFVAAYWVGDGGVGVYKRGEFVKLLGDGERALFAEHPSDPSNRFKLANAKKSELPWKDTAKLPYTLTGPYLSKLFERAFIEGLHHPETRPQQMSGSTS